MRSKIFLLVFVIASVISFRLSAQDAMFYFKYADKGDKEAMCRLGDCYLRGEGGVEQNLTAALNWYVKAAKKGYPEGLFLAAYCYFYGIGTSESFLINGYGYLTKAVKKEYIPAYWLLAQYYKSSKLNSLYLSNLRKSAEANYAHGQAEYGALYLYGSNELGVNQDISRGLSWIKKAAENNNALGLYYWAICYEAGSGMEANLAKALEYYEKSAQLGNAEAQARVGYAYLSGEMGDVDYATAYQYFTAAAEQNNAYAYGKIGDMHYYGLGTEENNSKAKEMYEAAVVDGATEFTILVKIFVPLAKPAIASITLFFAMGQWNSYLTPSIYLTTAEKYPLQVVLRDMLINMTGQNANDLEESRFTPEALKNATIFISVLPFLIVYPFLQKYFVKGLTLGAVKG